MKFTNELYQRTLKQHDHYMGLIIKNQLHDTHDWREGGIMSVHEGMLPLNGASLFRLAVMLYLTDESKYYRSDEAFDFAMNFADFLEYNMTSEGLLHFYKCNFESAPDTSFSLQDLAEGYRFLQNTDTDKKGDILKDRMYALMIKMADGILTGGFHTPNHRWVIASALSIVYSITKDGKYKKKIDEYLAEGIDCDEQGEYTERSSGGYNHVNNNALIILSQELDMPELLEHVRRNLIMMLYYIDKDYRIFTNNSTRQDKGGPEVFLDMYYTQYLKTGHLLGDKLLLSVAKALEIHVAHTSGRLLVGLPDLVSQRKYLDIPDDIQPFELGEYMKFFEKSKIAKMSHNDFIVTIMENSEMFMYIRYKELDMYIQGGVLFFNERHVKVKNLREIENGFAMDYTGSGRYLLPFGQYQGTPYFREMDMSKRKTTPLLTITLTIEVTKTLTGLKIRTIGKGIDKASIRYDIALNKNVLIKGDGYAIRTTGGGIMFHEKGYLTANLDSCGLKIGPGKSDTYIHEGLFGTLPLSQDKHHVFLNYLIPFEHEFTIEPTTGFGV